MEDAADEALRHPGSCSGRLGRHGQCPCNPPAQSPLNAFQSSDLPAAQRHRRAVGGADLGRGGGDQSVAAERRAADEQQRRADVVFPPAALVPAVGVRKVPELPEQQEPQLSLLPADVSHSDKLQTNSFFPTWRLNLEGCLFGFYRDFQIFFSMSLCRGVTRLQAFDRLYEEMSSGQQAMVLDNFVLRFLSRSGTRRAPVGGEGRR